MKMIIEIYDTIINLVFERIITLTTVSLNDKILKGFDQGLMTDMILIDLQKAFDTNDNDILQICMVMVSLNIQ